MSYSLLSSSGAPVSYTHLMPKEAQVILPELETLDFIRQGRNLVLYGNPGNEYKVDDIENSVKKAWMDETGKKESDIKEMQIYIKPEENAAYYVINNEYKEGGNKVDL